MLATPATQNASRRGLNGRTDLRRSCHHKDPIMLRTWSRFPVLLAVCLVLLVVSRSSAQTQLRWKFQQGQVLNQTFQQDMKIAMTIGAQNVNTAMKQTFDGVWHVGAVDDQGAAEVVQKFSRVRMTMKAPMGIGFEFDSDSEEPPTGIGVVLAPTLHAMAKAKFTMKMTPQGVIEDVQISQETLDALKTMPGAEQLGGAFTQDGLVNMVKQGSTQFLPEAIQKGRSWTNKLETKLPQVGKMEALSKLVYAGPETVDGQTLERIDVELTTKIVPQEDGTAKVSIKDQSAKGTIYFDNVAGRISHSSMIQQMTMSVVVAGNNIQQKIDQKISIRLTPAQN